jgi:asparagine synthase (glutamine-hydrolysing)
MGIWHDQGIINNYTFISAEEKIEHYVVGLIRAPYLSGTIYKYTSSKSNFLLAIDGEIENLKLLSAELGVPSEDVVQMIYGLYHREGAEGLLRIQGTASIILFDFENEKTILYRSFLNGYPLYFTTKNNRLTVCTNPVFLLHRDDISDTVDRDKIAKLFSINPLNWTGTVFSEISEVAHGEVVCISSRGIERKKHSLKNIFHSKYCYRNEKIAFAYYRTLLESAVNERIQPNKKYGIMLSSGIDSSSIAYFAAKKLHLEGRELKAYSWKLPSDSADESKSIELICKELNIPLKMFHGEIFGPFDALDSLFLLPDTPFVNSFWGINQECYSQASEDGVDFLLNGNFADLLFVEKGSQFKSMWRDRRFDLLFPNIAHIFKRKGFLGLIRSVLFRVLPLKKDNRFKIMPWLTTEAHNFSSIDENHINDKEFKNFQSALCSFQSGYLGGERYLSGRYGLYRSEPHRNIALMHYSLGFPNYMTYREGKTKFFVREAMRGLLPNKILNQPRVGLLSSFALKSFERNKNKVREKIWEDVSSWNYYVKEEWMRDRLKDGAVVDNKDLYVIWLCINLTAWLKAIKPGGSLYES